MACTGEKRATLHSSLFCVGRSPGKQSTSFVFVAFLFNVFGEDSVPKQGEPTLVTRVRRNPGLVLDGVFYPSFRFIMRCTAHTKTFDEFLMRYIAYRTF